MGNIILVFLMQQQMVLSHGVPQGSGHLCNGCLEDFRNYSEKESGLFRFTHTRVGDQLTTSSLAWGSISQNKSAVHELKVFEEAKLFHHLISVSNNMIPPEILLPRYR